MLVANEVLMSSLRSRRAVAYALKLLLLLSTAALDALVVLRYRAHTAILHMQNALPATATVWSAFWPWLVLEVLLCSFHIPPFLSGSFRVRQFYGYSATTAADCPAKVGYRLEKHGNACYAVYEYRVEAMGAASWVLFFN